MNHLRKKNLCFLILKVALLDGQHAPFLNNSHIKFFDKKMILPRILRFKKIIYWKKNFSIDL